MPKWEAKARRMREAGATLEKIGAACGVTAPRVHEVLHGGKPKSGTTCYIPKETLDDINRIATAEGMSRQVAIRAILEWGIESYDT